jgi:hypothetical protein
MNGWVVQANTAAREWMRSPEEGGADANSFQNMRNNRNSLFSQIISKAQEAKEYLKFELKDELEKSTLSDGAVAMFRFMVPAVKRMHEQYGELSERKGCPHLFVFLLQHMDCMLQELRILVPESFTPPTEPESPTEPQTPTEPLPPHVNPLYAPKFEGKPLDAAKQIYDWVKDAKEKCYAWEPDLDEGGTDADSFAEMVEDVFSPFSTILIRIGDAAAYLEHEPNLSAAYKYCRRVLLPIVESMRGQYEELGELKECSEIPNNLLIHIDRVLKVLGELKPESSAPLARSQPPAQSTQQIPPQQPAPQTANPLFRHAEPHVAVTEIKNAIDRMKKRPDGPKVIHEMRWTADFLESGPRSTHKANHILRSCLRDAQDMYQQYRQLCITYGHDQTLQSLKTEVDRVVVALQRFK